MASTTTRSFPLKYFILTFAFTWFFWWLAVLGERGVIPALPGLVVLGTFGPALAAVVVTSQEGGRAALRSLLSRVLRWRAAPVWYVVALLGPLVLQSVAIGLHVILGGQTPDLLALIGALPIVMAISIYMLIFVALGEEVGWRGYALPALQAHHGALLASVILGVVWTVWHLPQFFNPSTLYSDLPFVVFLAYLVPFAVLITWVFNSTGGSVLMVMILHSIMNASSRMWKALPEYSRPLSGLDAAAATVHVNLMGAIVLWAAAVVVILVYGPRELSRRPRQVTTASGAESREQPRVR